MASKAALKRGKLTSGGPRQKDLVQALDPDASIREIGLRGGGELASEDHVSNGIVNELLGKTRC